MSVKIVKRGSSVGVAAAPVVEGGLVAEVAEPKALASEPTPEERERWWQEHVPPPNAKPRKCPYCRHEYLMPCDEKRHAACANYLFLQGKKYPP